MYRIDTMDKPEAIQRLSYSILEVAKTLGVSSRTVHNIIKRGELSHFRVGQRVLIPADILRQFIAERTSRGHGNQSRPLHRETEAVKLTHWVNETDESVNADTTETEAANDTKVPKQTAPPVNDARDKRIYELWHNEDLTTEGIGNIINKEYKDAMSKSALTNAARRYCKRYNLELPRKKRGRRAE